MTVLFNSESAAGRRCWDDEVVGLKVGMGLGGVESEILWISQFVARIPADRTTLFQNCGLISKNIFI